MISMVALYGDFSKLHRVPEEPGLRKPMVGIENPKQGQCRKGGYQELKNQEQ